MSNDWSAILPLLILAAGGFFIFCAGISRTGQSERFLFNLAVVSALGCGVAAFIPTAGAPAFWGLVESGGYARYFTVVFAFIALVTLFFAQGYARVGEFAGDEFYGVVLFATLGMVLTAGAAHWVTFFLGVELLSVSLYILIAMQRRSATACEAAIKYFIMGSVSSGFLVFGIAVIYAATGKMDIAQSLGAALQGKSAAGLMLGMGLLTVGMSFKMSLVPFHLWTPDVYQGAPAPITAFLSTGSKIALVSALLRFALNASPTAWNALMPVLWSLAALTMIVGNVTALAQTHIKRMLAYSSMAQMGYIVMALLAVRQGGAGAVLFYSTAYALMDLGAFGSVGVLSSTRGDLDSIEDYRGLGFARPWPSALLAVCLLALAGLPPTAGFIGKFALFQAAVRGGFLILAVIGILTAIVSVYYYIRVVVALYMHPQESETAAPAGTVRTAFVCAAVLALIFAAGIAPSGLFELFTRIVTEF